MRFFFGLQDRIERGGFNQGGRGGVQKGLSSDVFPNEALQPLRGERGLDLRALQGLRRLLQLS